MINLRCPICAKVLEGNEANPEYPFCSPRCKLIDLGRWLGGAYAIVPDEEADDPAVTDEYCIP